MTKVEIDIHDAQILCGAVCDLLYLNAAIQKEEDEETK